MGRHRAAPAPSPVRNYLTQHRRAIAVAGASAATVAIVLTAGSLLLPVGGPVPAIGDEAPLRRTPSATATLTPTPTPTVTTPTTTPPPPPSTTESTREKDQGVSTTRERATATEEAIENEAAPTIPRSTPRATPPPAELEADDTGQSCASTGFNGVREHVARVGHHIEKRYEIPILSILGVGSRARASDHPSGLALDFMVSRSVGDDLAAYVLANRGDFAVTYVIWRQRINYGGGWEMMEDRGSATANHYDHVHVSFAPRGSSATIAC